MTRSPHVTIGTAGHVDHGKTSLVKALTGVDTDRWAEEKRRGMTIDLGFARWDLPGGRQAAIVDVPGHERFLRNMLAGVTGMDLVLLVVAADDGVMPQTREHVDILHLLRVRRGVVVLTKTDLVDADLLDLAHADVRQALAGTFLAEAPVIPVSTVTGTGLDALRDAVDQLTREAPTRSLEAPPRLAIDRVFSRTGFGTVVTGTMVAGRWHEGDKVTIWPGDREARIRGMQVHGDKVSEAQAGQRVALNLAGIDMADLARGAVVGASGTVRTSQRFAADVELLAGHAVPLQHRDRVRVHVGTAEAIGRVVVIGSDCIRPGERGLVVIELEGPIAVDFHDRFVLRRFSPLLTLGGGVVLHPTIERVRRQHRPTIERLRAYAAGDLATALLHRMAGFALPIARDVAVQELPYDRTATIDALIADGRLTHWSGIGLMATTKIEGWATAIVAAVTSFLASHPWRLGMPREALLADVRLPAALADRLLERLVEQGALRRHGSLLVVPGHQARWPASSLRHWQAFDDRLAREGILDTDALRRETPALAAHLTDHLFDRVAVGNVVAVGQDIVVSTRAWHQVLDTLQNAFPEAFTASQAREALGLSRRFVIPILEYCDHLQLTRRQGDRRTVVRRDGP